MNAGLDELSNHPEGRQISDHLASRNDRKTKRGPNPRVTDKTTAFAYHQTGTHGPQFGYRLVLVEEGNDVDFVSGQLNARGPISGDTAEMLVFPFNSKRNGPGEMIVLPERGNQSGSRTKSGSEPDNDDADDTDKRTIDYILNSSLLDNDIHIDIPTFQPGTIANKLRQRRCRTPTSLLTLGDYMQKITYTSSRPEDGPGQILVIIRRRNSPETVENEILSWIKGRASGSVEEMSGVCLVFEERGAGMVVFR
jgi:hypothetical protein